jgi:GNAT superfamily N-acetyltransferase
MSERADQPPATASPVVTVRRLAPSDSIAELTTLLHRAYAKQVAMGLRPLAGRQDEAMTKKRVFNGECSVAVDHVRDDGGRPRQKLVGTILFHEVEESQGPTYFAKPEVASFSQFAVDPDYQGQGLGVLMLDTVERRARETGAVELACTMAEPDVALMEFYFRRGYRLVGHHQWPYTNYRSAILSKTLR